MQIKNSRYCIITRCGYKVLSCSFPFWHESSSVPAYPITAFLILRSLCSSWFPITGDSCNELTHLTHLRGRSDFLSSASNSMACRERPYKTPPKMVKDAPKIWIWFKAWRFRSWKPIPVGLKWCFLKPPISRVQHPSFEEYPMWFHVYSFFYSLAEVSKLAKVLERMAIGPETEGDHIETYSGLWHGAHWGLGHMKQRE